MSIAHFNAFFIFVCYYKEITLKVHFSNFNFVFTFLLIEYHLLCIKSLLEEFILIIRLNFSINFDLNKIFCEEKEKIRINMFDEHFNKIRIKKLYN